MLFSKIGSFSLTVRHEKMAHMPAGMFRMFNCGMIVLDKAGRAPIINEVAARLMEEHDLCYLDGSGVLRSKHTRLDKALRKNGAAKDRDGVTVARVDVTGMRPIAVWIAPPQADTGESEADRVVLIMTSRRTSPAAHTLAMMLDITPAEARLLHHLIAGNSLMACARMFDVSYNTVRNQLNSVLSKTGAASKTDLMLLVEQLLPPISLAD